MYKGPTTIIQKVRDTTKAEAEGIVPQYLLSTTGKEVMQEVANVKKKSNKKGGDKQQRLKYIRNKIYKST